MPKCTCKNLAEKKAICQKYGTYISDKKMQLYIASLYQIHVIQCETAFEGFQKKILKV